MVTSMGITFDTVAPFLRVYLKEIIVNMDAGGRVFTEASALITKK